MHVGGEPNSVSVDVITEWQTNELPALLARHDEKGVFNANESGLFQKAKRNRTYTVSGSQCHDGKHSKKRLFVLICCNMSGTKKPKRLVIGKARQPCALQPIKNVPVEWTANRKAWMKKDMFNNWLLQFNRGMIK